MAISTAQGIVDGMRPATDWFKVGTTLKAIGTLFSTFYAAGIPAAAAAPSPGLGGANLTSYAGQFPFSNPASGNSYLGRLQASTTTLGAFFLCDRLWHNSGIVSSTTTSQTISSGLFPARDRSGSTNGEDVMIGLEWSAAASNGAVSNTTVGYTNSAGTGSRTATLPTTPTSATIGMFLPFGLDSGDTGVRSIGSITLGTSYVNGTMHLVAYRVLARLEVPFAQTTRAIDAISAALPRLYDGTVPFLLYHPGSTTTPTLQGAFSVSQG